MMPWNKREVYMGFSMDRCTEIQGILANNNIECTYKVINRNSNNRGKLGTLGEKVEFTYTYYVYVHKKDYEFAMQSIF